MKNKGRLHPEIEKLLAKMPSWKSTQNTGTSYDKVMHIFNVIVAMMPEMGSEAGIHHFQLMTCRSLALHLPLLDSGMPRAILSLGM